MLKPSVRQRLIIRRMTLALAIVGVGAWAFAAYMQDATYYASGWWAAECELWRGEATIYTGLLGFGLGDNCYIDRDTGLPIFGLACCTPRPGDGERVTGHNDHIAQYIRWHGLPKNTFKPWERELFDLYHFCDERSRVALPTKLLAGGPAVVSPDGRSSLRLVVDAKCAGIPEKHRRVVISAGKFVLREHYAHFEKGDSDLFWGPEGSRFAVVRSVFQKKEHYVAYDLRTGRHLREES
jgi:hypothetical protein